jgi:4-hydroxythreonine-4-phosphate dehydrogenase
MRPRVAVTLGDPRGIGPEVAAKALEETTSDAEFVVIGPAELVDAIDGHEKIAVGGKSPPRLPASRFTLPFSLEEAGHIVADSVKTAVALALRGDVDAIVTAPAEKRALHAAGYAVPGHTEWLAQLAGGVDVAMMLVTGRLRVVLLTTHIPFRDVVAQLTAERIRVVAAVTRGALAQWWEIGKPHIALCALNPHAGEAGLFGDEEERLLAPLARELELAGPIPADTVFVRALRGEFDAVLTPYHDLGMAAVKVAGFGTGVNVTLGLPFIRTAPDHGTAFDIAGKGIADPGSMGEAIRLAVALATHVRGGMGHRA